jgi:quinol monooxygenase YgiN
MFVVWATLRVKPGKLNEFRNLVHLNEPQVQAEPGFVSSQVFRTKEDPNVFKVLQIFADDEAWRLHGERVGAPEFKDPLMEVLVGAPEAVFLEPATL